MLSNGFAERYFSFLSNECVYWYGIRIYYMIGLFGHFLEEIQNFPDGIVALTILHIC